jgi:hypothetical protein
MDDLVKQNKYPNGILTLILLEKENKFLYRQTTSTAPNN